MKRSVLLFLSGLAIRGAVIAQHDTIALPFRQFTIEDGLSQGMVTRITQDRHGFMWFATKDGLDRYDGYHFKVFRHDGADTTTIVENYTTVVQEDSRGRIWVGTATKGLDVFLPESEVFRRIRLGPAGDASMVMGVIEDRDGNIWAATTKGLFKITFPASPADPPKPATLPPYSVRRYFERQSRITRDHAGHVWGYLMGSFSFRITPSASGSERIDTVDMEPLRSGPWTDDLNTSVNGLFLEDPRTRRMYGVHPYFIAEYDTLTLVPHIIHRIPYPEGQRLEADQMLFDEKGAIWIGANYLWRFDLPTGRMTRILARDQNLKNILESTITLFQDRSGSVWIGSSGYGLLLYDRRIERFNMHPDGSMHWMSATPDDRVIALKNYTCLAVYDPRTRSYALDLSDHDPEVRRSFTGLVEETPAAVQDADGLYWLCKGNIYSHQAGTDDFTCYTLTDMQGTPIIHRKGSFPLFQDGNSALWFGCDTNFYRFDKSSHRFTSWRYPVVPVYTPYSFVQAIHKDASGLFWLATLKGLLRLDPTTGEWTHYRNDPQDMASISFDVIFSILPDPAEPQHYLWLGTNGGGLNRFDMRTGHCDRYTVKDGLPNDVVYGILDDEGGDLWMSTNKGISRFTPSTGAFRNYDASDGLQSDEFNRNAFCKMKDGTLYFGGVNGFNFFHPKDLEDDTLPVDVRITDIRLMNRSIAFKEAGSPLHAPAYLSEGMEIPYGTNMVTFEFASMEFAAPGEHRYQYKLEGFDPDWIMSGTSNSAIYTNLDPGTYTFRVRGENRDGIWDEHGTSFHLVVNPPWWMHWWFYALCALAVAGGIMLYVRGLRRQKLKLEETVEVRTRELSRAKERAEKSELIKQQFLANMSHEIRTPMNAIMGMTGILRRNQHPPEQDKYLDAIAQSSDNLLVIINDILDLSKMEAGKIMLEQVPFDPRTVIGNVRDMLHFKAEEKGLAWSTEIGDGTPTTLIGDPTRLQQVLLNLVSNAIKFTEKGGITLRMSVGDRTGDRCTLRVQVIDTGIGIPADRVHRIFDEFTQAYSDTSRKYGGTGLGLSISKRLVELQGGTITVNSEHGKGSTFTVAIPYIIAAGIARPRRSSPVARPQRALRDLRILLAEDNEFNAMVAQDELADAIPGVQVDRAENGLVAVRMAQAGTYDVILMDVQMPEMNGYDATRAIRSLADGKSRVPIIAMTANVMAAELELCRKAGMTGHIPKPFTREELVSALQRGLANDSSTGG